MRPGMVSDLFRLTAIGLLALAASPEARANNGNGIPDARIGTRVAPILLLSRSDIRDDLGLTPAQVAESEQAISDLQDKALPLKGRIDAEADRVRSEINGVSARWLKEHLTVAQQTRLIQLDLQWEGPSALLTRPVVADTLHLTQNQRAKLGQIIAERNTKRNSGPAVPADEIHLFRSTLAVLDDNQKVNWRAMLGPIAPFQVAIHPIRESSVQR